MGIFSGPKTPAPPPLPPAAPPPKKITDPAVSKAKGDQRRRALGSVGRSNTFLTQGGAQGLTSEANTARKSLLGI